MGLFFMQWEQLIDEFILELEVLGRADNTIKNYKSKLRHYAKHFQEMEIEPLELTRRDVNDYVRYLVDLNYQNSTINITISRLKILFDFAVEMDFINVNPVRYKNRPVTKKVIAILSNEEVKRMLKVAKNHTSYAIINQRDYVIFMMLIDCGLRISEICNLNHQDIMGNQLFINKSKYNKDRVVGISPILRKEINKYIRMKENYYKDTLIDKEAFFISYHRNRLSVKTTWQTMSDIKEDSKIREVVRFSPHTLRHTYAHMQIENGIDIYTLSLNMGHYDVGMTQKYLQNLRSADFLDKSIAKSNLMHLRH